MKTSCRKIVLMLMVSVLTIQGCVTVTPLPTASGKPEVIIDGVTTDMVSQKLILDLSQAGAVLQSQTDNSLMFTVSMTGLRAAVGQSLLGNSYSTTPQDEFRFVFSDIVDGVHLILFPTMSTQMAFGQVRRSPVTNYKSLTEMQGYLDKVKMDMEAGRE